jgi:hypothetical protein
MEIEAFKCTNVSSHFHINLSLIGTLATATLKQIRPPTLGNPLKGMAFSAFVHYKVLDGPREFTYNGTDFTTFLFNKPMYSSPDDNSLPIGRAL